MLLAIFYVMEFSGITTWLQMTRGPKHEAVKLQGPKQKMREFARQVPLSKRRQGLTWSSTNIQGSVRSVCGGRWPPNRVEKGMGRPAHADRPTPFPWLATPFDLDAPLVIYSPFLRRPPHPFIREPPNWGIHTEGSRRRRESSTLPMRWLRLDPSRHGWPCMKKPCMVEFRSHALYSARHMYFWRWYQSNLVSTFDLLRCMPSLIHACS
jgi:hypothetical protein